MQSKRKGERFSRKVNEFHGLDVPETMSTAGYASLIDHYDLKVPLPSRLAGISETHHPVGPDHWPLLTPPLTPEDTFPGDLDFPLERGSVKLRLLYLVFG